MILVTGSSGFLGAAILRSFGDKAIGLQRKASDNKERLVACDLTNEAQVRSAIDTLQNEQITHFIHTAAMTPWSNNVDFSLDLIMASSVKTICDKLNILNLLVLSGWNVYDMSGSAPFSENTPIDPIDEYGSSKYAVEKFFHESMKNKVINLRLASVYGEGQVSAGLITNLVSSAISGNKIFLRSISTKRDYIYIDDVVESIQKIVEQNNMQVGAMNIGSGHSVSVQEVAETIVLIMQQDYNNHVYIKLPDNTNESMPLDNQLDITKAKQIGLLQQPTSLKEGLGRYIKWRVDENIL